MVDVETGERPSGMRPLSVPADTDPAQRPAPPQPKVRPVDAGGGTPVPDAGARAGAGGETSAADAGSSEAPFGTDGLLSLDDSSSGGPASPAGDDDAEGTRPWRRGLRG
jgi:hypothetical protein